MCVSSSPRLTSPGAVRVADNEEIFKGLDRSIATFKKYGMTVVMTLSNFCPSPSAPPTLLFPPKWH